MEIIQFAPTRPDYVPLDNIKPQPAKNFIPDWYKKMPNHLEKDEPATELLRTLNSSTVKRCPSFRDIFKYGIVMPAPCDIYLSATKKEWRWETPSGIMEIEYHEDYQFKDHYPDDNVKGVFKLHYPLMVKTPPGYSVMQIPLLYHYNPDWHFAWGILDSDQYHDVNPQLIYTSDKTELLIRQGDPLFYYYPYKRAEWEVKMLEYGEMQAEQRETRWKLSTKFAGRYHKNFRRRT